MIEVYRIIPPTQLYAEEATSTADKADYLNALLESTKPHLSYKEWHRLIAAPFRYRLPVPVAYGARFRPPYYSRNVLYAAGRVLTALYEHAFHYLRQRVHLQKAKRESAFRLLFSLFINPQSLTDIHHNPDIARIMDRQDYAPSHAYILNHPEIRALLYPSCRDPERRENYAVFDIEALGKTIGDQQMLACSYNPKKQSIRWIDLGLTIEWKSIHS